MDPLLRPAASRRARLLGGLRLARDETPLTLPGSKPQALLAYLLLHPETPHHREKLADLLWPHAGAERVRRYLSDTLYRLQQTLGYDWLMVQGESVTLPREDLWVDVWEFERLSRSDDLAAQTAAVSLYQDDLLPEQYENWLLPRRVALREKLLAVLVRLAHAAEQAGQLDNAFTHYHRLTTVDPLNEAAQRGLMRVYARMGRAGAALAQYERLQQTLATELDVEPLPATQSLAASIQAEYELSVTTVAAKRPFVGRRAERTALLQAVERAAQGRGGVVLLEGAAGVGKSRLLQVVAESAEWRGMQVAWGKAGEFDAPSPYAPLDQALETAVGTRSLLLVDQLSPIILTALTALVPALQQGPAIPLTHAPDIAAALREGLALLSADTPLLLILDDVHWAGPAFWEMLAAAPHFSQMKVLLLLAYRPLAVRTDPKAWPALQALDTAAAPLRLSIGGLSMANCAELVRELGQPLPKAELERLHRRTGGNPLYFEEALAAQRGTAVSSLDELLQTRLTRLEPAARRALEVAAVLGQEFDYGAWQAAGGATVRQALPALVTARFIEATEQGYRFQHDLTRQQVYNEIAPARLRAWHHQVARSLRQVQAEPETLAWHFARAEAWAEAIHYEYLAGVAAVRAYAYEAALAHFDRAVTLYADHAVAPADYARILIGRQQVLRILVRLEAWQADIEELERLTVVYPDPAIRLAILESRIRLAAHEDLDTMRAAIDQALEMIPNLDDPAQEAHVLQLAGYYLSDILGQYEKAIELVQRAADLALQIQAIPTAIESLCTLASAQLATGSCRRAHETAARALALTELVPHQYPARAHALAVLGHVTAGLTQWEQSYTAFRKAIALFEELGDVWNMGEALFNFALTASMMGQHGAAVEAAARIVHAADQVGLAQDSEIRVWYMALLLSVTTRAGDFAAAAPILRGVTELSRVMGEGRALIAALTAEGQYYVRQDRPEAALASLSRAFALWQQMPNYGDLGCVLLYALVTKRTGALGTAQAALAMAEEMLATSDATSYRVLAAYVRFEVTEDPVHMDEAYRELERQAQLITDEKLRADFWQSVFLHHEIVLNNQARRAATVPAKQVRLVRADVPLGRPLTAADYVTVEWVVDAGDVDQTVFQEQGKVALRRFRIQRLLAAATAQGAAPTDEDLARALAVSRRTVERDMKALRKQGVGLPTRRRK